MPGRICLIILLIIMTALVGCVGARPKVRLDSAKYPVSMSGVILDRNGQPLYPNEQIAVGRFKAEKTGYAMGYSFLQLAPMDFSEELNNQVSSVNGEAVVNLEVKKIFSLCRILHVIQITQILPFFLGCSKVHVEGDIIRSKSPPGMTNPVSETDRNLRFANPSRKKCACVRP